MNPYHAKYIAHDITLRKSVGHIGNLTEVLLGSNLQLLPHQIDAALFALRSPFSEGAILADEVGLGKTIEAGLVLSRIWKARASRVLVIVPASLRRQWESELESKFSLPSMVVENRSGRRSTASGGGNGFDRIGVVLICSYEYAALHAEDITPVPWDLVICDEAHRLRNVDQRGTTQAKAIRSAVAGRRKLLLTATPLQNSVEELDGLLSFIDHRRPSGIDVPEWDHVTRWGALKREERLGHVCKRTLRSDVRPYIMFTKRKAKLYEFDPQPEELELWNRVADFLAKKPFRDLGIRGSGFLEMVVWKLLASSHFAVAETFRRFADRFDGDAELERDLTSIVEEDMELDSDDSVMGDDALGSRSIDASEEVLRRRTQLAQELRALAHFAASIEDDRSAKAKALLNALDAGIEQVGDDGAATTHGKAVVFTESRRTQEYLFRYLESHGYRGRVVTFNGSNDDERSRAILERRRRSSGRRETDMRTALIAQFRDTASILLVTESGAEGLNLQFCNLVVNYDLPWNPQRIEQRIGRCHRIGQVYDVIVCNFINRSNVADRRVHDLLKDKLKLFKGFFGSSDEVLGRVMAADIDLEKEFARIYSDCRTAEEINEAFDRLQERLSEDVKQAQRRAGRDLLHNFDQSAIERLFQATQADIARQQRNRRSLARYFVGDSILEHEDGTIEILREVRDIGNVPIPKGKYRIGGDLEPEESWRSFDAWLNEPLVHRGKAINTPLAYVVVDPGSVAGAGRLSKGSGWMECRLLSLDSVDPEDFLLLAGVTDSGEELADEECQAILGMPGEMGSAIAAVPEGVSARLEDIANRNQRQLAAAAQSRLDDWGRDERDLVKEWEKRLTNHVTNAAARIKPEMDVLQRKRSPTSADRERLSKLQEEYEDAVRNREARLSMIRQQRMDRVTEVNDRSRMEQRVERLFVLRWQALPAR